MTNDENDTYNKPAWVYLPAGYDPEDKDTKYPLFILMHGFGQTEDNWGLTDQGSGGKIKGMMDRGMAKPKDEEGSVEKFILVVPTGMATRNYRENGNYDYTEPYYRFGGELRNDLIPYMKKNYNIKEGRENMAMAGLSMGGFQTLYIGIGECLDIMSYFGFFSYPFTDDLKEKIETNFPEKDLTIKRLYTICGDNDPTPFSDFYNYVDVLSKWDKVEDGNFSYEVYPGGTHDFPVWYRGFEHFIPQLFK